MTTKNNYLKHEINEAKSLGFTMAYNAKNPTMRLADGRTLVWLAGKLIGIVTTETFFGGQWHLMCWKSSDTNKPCATMTSTQLCADGITKQTLIYYREVNRPIIKQLAMHYKCAETDIVIDHINHRRGCNYDENLRPATYHQNSQNKSKEKVEAAFYTIDEIVKMLSVGELEPIDEAVRKKYRLF